MSVWLRAYGQWPRSLNACVYHGSQCSGWQFLYNNQKSMVGSWQCVYSDKRQSTAGVWQCVCTMTINNQQLLSRTALTVTTNGWSSCHCPLPIACHCNSRCQAQVSNCCVSAAGHTECHCSHIARQQPQ